MPVAVCLIRDTPHYRREAFVAGLVACGYQVAFQPPVSMPKRDDILVTWNRGAMFQYHAKRHESVGSRIIVAENGYLDTVDADGHQFFSLALDHHNGVGRWFPPRTDADAAAARWPVLAQSCLSWRKEGSHILVLPQRGIGAPGVAMPRLWLNDIRQRLARLTRRQVRIRPHPGVKSKATPLAPDLENCHAIVTWGSGGALKAMLAGYPVFHDMPGWIGAGAAVHLAKVTNLEAPMMDDGARSAMFERLAWSQWPVADIASGYALRRLLTEGNA